MVKIKGKKELKEQLKNTRNYGDRSGIQGELLVVDALEKYLGEEDYIIIQPAIGSMSPDILVISPDFGFRIIEVKNWKLNNISEIKSNGSITMKNHKNRDNPLNQV